MHLTTIDYLAPENTTKFDSSYFFESDVGSSRLVIAAGDSWTWGDSLGAIDRNAFIYDDPDIRTREIYGRKLSDMLGADLVNIGMPGFSNIQILNRLEEVLSSLVKSYDEIVVVVSLTEGGRDFHEREPEKNMVPQSFSTIDDCLLKHEQMILAKVDEIMGKYPAKYLITRNFVHTYEQNVTDIHASKIWVDILEENQSNPLHFPENLRVLSWISIELIQIMLYRNGRRNDTMSEMIELMDRAQLGIDWLHESTLNNKIATKHPNELAHTLWAEYLREELSRVHGIK